MVGPQWRPRSTDIPTQPGVYRFIDSRAKVIYVGKAKNLRNRLNSYFASPESLIERTRRMVQTARSVDWTVVQTERAALQLEYAWIKEFQPDFNIRFRDDKSYPYLVVTVADDIPRVFLSRRKDIAGAKYFGPFSNSWALKDTLSTLLRAFPVRSCTQGVYARAKKSQRPCLLGDIGKCAAPCVGRVEPAEHKALALGLAAFMDGKDDGVLDGLRYEMLQAAERLDFERAAKLRDRVEAIETILVKNTMVLDDTIDADVFGLAQDELHAAAHVFRIRSGRIRQARGWVVDVDTRPSKAELVELILRDGFDEHFPPARTILVPEMPKDESVWSDRLSEQRKVSGERGSVEIRVAKRGDLKTLADTVRLNAAQTLQGYLSKRQNDVVSRSAALAELGDYLQLDEAPLRIECFDVSHLGGDNPVASMVVFEDGIPRREHYRKFSVEGARDDTEAIHQVISRRVARLLEPVVESDEKKDKSSFAYPPGLFVIDGGLPQVNAAQKALAEAGVSIAVCGLAKRLEEVWRPGDSFPLVLPRNSESLFLLQRLRDEAHRVAITYQRTTRKRSLKSQLLDIPGVGESMTKKLLTTFGSVAGVKEASVEDLTRVSGVGPQLASRIHSALHDSS